MMNGGYMPKQLDPHLGTAVGFVLKIHPSSKGPGRWMEFGSANELRAYSEKEELVHPDRVFYTIIEGDGPAKHREESEGASPDCKVGDRFILLMCSCGESEWFHLTSKEPLEEPQKHVWYTCEGCKASMDDGDWETEIGTRDYYTPPGRVYSVGCFLLKGRCRSRSRESPSNCYLNPFIT
jgi:hypothetical protein